MLKNVVFPAPFGPIRLATVPRSIAKSTSSTASPPNSLRSCTVSRIASIIGSLVEELVVPDVVEGLVVHALVELGCPSRARDQALRPEEHDDDEDHAED